MSDVLIILCIFPSTAQARQIGTLLVGRQLADCVNIISIVESVTEALAILNPKSEVR